MKRGLFLRLKRKFCSQGGESLIEVLASVLVALLAVGLLASAIAASSRIGAASGEMDEDFYRELAEAEAQESQTEPGTVKVTPSDGTPIEYAVDYYGGEDVYSYRQRTEESAP